MAIATVNPATGELLTTFEPLTGAEIEEKLQLAASAFAKHRRTSFADRASKMQRAAEILEKEKDECARLMTLEMGKPLKAAVAEALKCATGCRYYAENAERFLADEIIETGAKKSFVRYLPIGPILAIMPWNFPFWQVFRFVAPALMAGNVGLLKHASNVPQCALKIEEIVRRAGFAAGVFQTLLIGSGPVDSLLSDSRVVAALTAPTSPRTITVTYPEPIYSFPMRMTLAALTMASAASIEATSPLVSIIPNASLDMRSSSRLVRDIHSIHAAACHRGALRLAWHTE